jgi:hypothetical protein
MCNRKVTSPDDILERLEYHVDNDTSDGLTRRYCELFKRHMHRYIKGVGHPNHDDARNGDLLPPGAFAREADNRTLRAELLLTVTTDSNLLPAESTWCIQVSRLIIHHVLCADSSKFNITTSLGVCVEQGEASTVPSSSRKVVYSIYPYYPRT